MASYIWEFSAYWMLIPFFSRFLKDNYWFFLEKFESSLKMNYGFQTSEGLSLISRDNQKTWFRTWWHWESNLPPRGTFLVPPGSPFCAPGVTFLCPGVDQWASFCALGSIFCALHLLNLHLILTFVFLKKWSKITNSMMIANLMN